MHHLDLKTLPELLALLRQRPPPYGPQAPEVRGIMLAALRMDPRVRPLTLHRFSYPSWLEHGREHYNINQMPQPGLFLSEGPAQRAPEDCREGTHPDPTALPRLLHATVLHPERPIRRILALGRHDDGVGFERYFDQSDTYEHTVKVIHHYSEAPEEGNSIAHHRLMVRSGEVEAPLEVLQVTAMPDFGTAQLGEQDLQHLHRWFSALPDEPLNIHCAAGLGRSGLMALAYALWRERLHWQSLPSREAQGAFVLQQLEALRRARPGVVQTQAQLEQAVSLALQLDQIK